MYQKFRKYPYHLRGKIKQELERLENEGIIESVTGPQEWVSNLVATPKSNGAVRLCLDARILNTAIERETHPIPTLETIIDDMNGSKVFSKIDMKEAYTQIVLDEESRKITNFHTAGGIKRFKRLCYGINNAFEIFQRALDDSIGNIPNVKCISDDILIYTSNKAEHMQTLKTLFDKIKKLGLKLNKNKCVFLKSSLSFFGVIISENGVQPDPNKIESIKTAQHPNNIQELRSFLGLITYVSKFIKNFSEKTAPLRKLLRKDCNFSWNKEQDDAFELLKGELCSDTILTFYNPNDDLELITDASGHAIGGVLLQRNSQNETKPITYISRSLSQTESKYSITEKEALSVVWCVEKLHHYLYGKKFILSVDHQPLRYIFNPRAKLSARIARWQLKLQAYNFDIRHIKGSCNIADFLSRIKYNEQTADDEDANLYVNFITHESIPKSMTLEQIRVESEKDEIIIALRNAIKENKWYNNIVKPYESMKNELCENNGVILRGNRIVLPLSLQSLAVKIVHEGHLGLQKSKELLRSKVYWKTLNIDIEKEIENCLGCKAASSQTVKNPIKMSCLPNYPWEEVAIDFFTPLPNGQKLLVLIDLYSRYPIIMYMKTTTAASVINKLENVFSMFGYPRVVRTDNGPPFDSVIFKKFLRNQGIKHRNTTPYYPQSNGVVERFMKVIGKTLKTSLYMNQNWKSNLNAMLLNYRSAPHNVTKKSPSLLLFNRNIENKLPTMVKVKSKYDDEVRENQSRNNEAVTNKFNEKHRVKDYDIKPGQHVLMKRYSRNKLDANYYKNIFKVIEVRGSSITIESELGTKFVRNKASLKVIAPYAENNKENCKNESKNIKQYPKRMRQSTDRFIVKN